MDGHQVPAGRNYGKKIKQSSIRWQFFVAFLGWLSDHLERLGDLELGVKVVTLNHLVHEYSEVA